MSATPSVVISYVYRSGSGIEHHAIRSGSDADRFIAESPERGRNITRIRIHEPEKENRTSQDRV